MLAAFRAIGPSLRTRAKPAQPSYVGLCERPTRVGYPQFLIRQAEEHTIRSAVGFRQSIIGVLEKLKHQAAAVIVSNLRFLADVLLQPRLRRAVDGEILPADKFQDALVHGTWHSHISHFDRIDQAMGQKMTTRSP